MRKSTQSLFLSALLLFVLCNPCAARVTGSAPAAGYAGFADVAAVMLARVPDPSLHTGASDSKS